MKRSEKRTIYLSGDSWCGGRTTSGASEERRGGCMVLCVGCRVLELRLSTSGSRSEENK